MKILTSLLAVTLLTACSTSPTYKKADDDGFGYSEEKLQPGSFIVGFKMRGEDLQTATDFALLRAAELTLKQGHEWFVVTDIKTEIDRQLTLPTKIPKGSEIQRNCGLLGCATTVTYPVGSMSITSYNEDTEIDSHINVILGSGARPGVADVYDARQLIANKAP